MKKSEVASSVAEVLQPGEHIKKLLQEAARGDSPIGYVPEKKFPRIEALFSDWRLWDVKNRVVNLYLTSSWADQLLYHNIFHTMDVYMCAVMYGEMERLSPEKRELLAAAAVFHDLGFIRQYKANEPYGAKIAEAIGKRFEYSEDELKVMSEVIMDTTMPQQPRSHLGKIICDSDLDNLGRPDFFFKGHLVRLELAIFDKKVMPDIQWLEFQQKFLKSHRYFTKAASLMRGEVKKKNLETVSEVIEVMRRRA